MTTGRAVRVFTLAIAGLFMVAAGALAATGRVGTLALPAAANPGAASLLAEAGLPASWSTERSLTSRTDEFVVPGMHAPDHAAQPTATPGATPRPPATHEVAHLHMTASHATAHPTVTHHPELPAATHHSGTGGGAHHEDGCHDGAGLDD